VCGCKDWRKTVQGERGPGACTGPHQGRGRGLGRAPGRLRRGRRRVRLRRPGGAGRDPRAPAWGEDPYLQVPREEGLEKEDRAPAGADPGKGTGGSGWLI
ncbi:MAG: LSU ribosomal protein L21p, partial [uncultured Rubrobacteraceae bacterium]